VATSAVARESLFSLRRQIARIEGRLTERLDPGRKEGADAAVVTRVHGRAAEAGWLATGVDRFDQALGGGLPRAALTEIHGAETRDAGAASGFALALAARALKEREAQVGRQPLLWIGTSEIFREAGLPYAPGLLETFGLSPEELFFVEAGKLHDALWVAEEAARLAAAAAVVVEVRGNAQRLDLTATLRLHRRAVAAGHPVLLLRQAALPEPTAAPVRLMVSPAAAAPRATLAGPLGGSIGRPAFTVTLGKAPAALNKTFELEWKSHDRAFAERPDPVAVVPLSRHGTDPAQETGMLVAFDAGPARAAGRQPYAGERAAHRGTRRAG
jgi:protein ImuA